MSDTYDILLPKIEEWIRHGNSALARNHLRKVLPAKVPRNFALKLASLSRRANIPLISLRVLYPIVRETRRSPVLASSIEKAEYAASLIKIGASVEAVAILDSIEHSDLPEVSLYKAFACITQWNYAGAIPLLRDYVSSTSISEYERAVGKVNLAAALVHGQGYEEAETVLQALLEFTQRGDYKLLYSNALQISAQNAFGQEQWTKAARALDKAEKAVSGASAFDQFFIQKWKTILHSFKHGNERNSILQLRGFRQKAVGIGHWETVRDCDWLDALITENEKLFIHVFYGTPFEGFRQKMREDYPKQVNVPLEYLYNVGNGDGEKVLDLFQGIMEGEKKGLKVGQSLHQLLVVLASDFYRPLRVAEIHSVLFPEAFFNPNSSPTRIYQVVKRLRAWLVSSRIPLQIDSVSGAYHFESKRGVGIRLRDQSSLKHRADPYLKRIEDKWTDTPFSVQEVGRHLKISSSTALRLVNEGIQSRILSKSGKTSKVRYSFTHFKKKAS